MKSFFKVKRNIIAFVIFLASFLLPLVAFGGDVIAYCMGYHHGFKEPWPTIQNILYISFWVIFAAFCIYILIVVIIQLTTTNKKIENKE